MKRYWELIIIAAFAIFVIGAFYIQKAVAENQLPTFEWKKQAGNDDFIARAQLGGSLTEDLYHNELMISADGTTYRSELSLIKELKGMRKHPIIEGLQEEHRNFMRGKDGELTHFYEDDNLLVYAEADSKWDRQTYTESDFQLNIDVLYKDKNDKVSFTVDIPNQDDYRYMMVEDVVVTNENLHVITRNELVTTDDQMSNELRIYRINLTGEKLINEESIVTYTNGGEDNNTEIMLLQDPEDIEKNNDIVFQADYYEPEQLEDGSYQDVVKDSKLFTFNLETREKVQLDIPKKLQKQEIIPVNDDNIYFLQNTAKGIEITTFAIAEQKVTNSFQIELPKQPDMPEIDEKAAELTGETAVTDAEINWGQYRMKDGKLYITSGKQTESSNLSMHVVDLNNGDILYKGKLERTDNPKAGTAYSLDFYEMTVK
ncbi:hypothetical protein RVS70_18705 [Virgibacillus sp. M23]|uniref:hypothetical protein n=1 Tax=Virgibacillus sp. M23 TaxID=3079030 RepID=UPI002A90F7A6|nr:hypothetical protein [Virgibacillus sp. M23]MDY7046221.1 hypothetical protein [Virgibacillus sp. M23]